MLSFVNIARGTTDPGYRRYKNKKYYFMRYSKAKKRSKRADHVNNVDSTINMLLLLG